MFCGIPFLSGVYDIVRDAHRFPSPGDVVLFRCDVFRVGFLDPYPFSVFVLLVAPRSVVGLALLSVPALSLFLPVLVPSASVHLIVLVWLLDLVLPVSALVRFLVPVLFPAS